MRRASSLVVAMGECVGHVFVSVCGARIQDKFFIPKYIVGSVFAYELAVLFDTPQYLAAMCAHSLKFWSI